MHPMTNRIITGLNQSIRIHSGSGNLFQIGPTVMLVTGPRTKPAGVSREPVSSPCPPYLVEYFPHNLRQFVVVLLEVFFRLLVVED